jgi:hypothetical protein
MKTRNVTGQTFNRVTILHELFERSRIGHIEHCKKVAYHR